MNKTVPGPSIGARACAEIPQRMDDVRMDEGALRKGKKEKSAQAEQKERDLVFGVIVKPVISRYQAR